MADAVKSRLKPIVVETYCQARKTGKTAGEAYRLSHPKCHLNNALIKRKAWEFEHHPVVQERMNGVTQEVVEQWSGVRDELLTMMTEEIRACYADNRTLSPVMKQVEQVCKILGLDKQTVELKAKLQPFDTDAATDKLNFLIAAAGSVHL